jgi:hypothetical protein
MSRVCSGTRFQVDNPHEKRSARARSTSINPVVYPEWWGEAQEIDSGYYKKRNNIPKRLKSADIRKAKINKYVARHCEDTLDRRLRKVHETHHCENPQIIPYREAPHQNNNNFGGDYQTRNQ